MKIEVWSDIVCPFCYIGKRRLEEALENFSHKDQVKVEFKSYQLDPNTPAYSGESYFESLAAKFGSMEQVKQMTANITKQAELVGLDFNLENAKQANTFDAHRITKFAKAQGKDLEVSEKLLQAHFSDAEDVGDVDVLANIAVSVGLSKEDALAVLQDKEAYATEVQADIEEAQQLGITGVPYFIVNRKYAISGAQPAETFIQALEKVWEEENTVPVFEDLSSTSDAACGDDGCAVPEQKKQ